MMPAYVDRLIVGTPTEVANVLRTAERRGVLVFATAPRPVAGEQVVVTARMVAPAVTSTPATAGRSRPVRRAWRSRSAARRAGILAAAGGVVVVSAALLYTVLWLVAVAWPLLLAAAALLFLLRRVQVRAGVCCPGLHCPGCRH